MTIKHQREEIHGPSPEAGNPRSEIRGWRPERLSGDCRAMRQRLRLGIGGRRGSIPRISNNETRKTLRR